MKYSIFIDESGNTGNPKYNNGRWNWVEQKYFALGSFSVLEEDVVPLRLEVKELLEHYNPEFGKTMELKAKAKYKYSKELLVNLLKVLSNRNAIFFIDIANKKFNLAKYITETCIYPLYSYAESRNIRADKTRSATIVFNNASDVLLNDFIVLCNEPLDNKLFEKVSEFVNRISDEIPDHDIEENCRITEECLANPVKSQIHPHNVLPIRDHTNKGAEISLLPHIDAFNNIVGSMSNIWLKRRANIKIIHDEQKDFSNSLTKWVEKAQQMSGNVGEIDIQFEKSHEDVLVMVADYITGKAVQALKMCVEEPYLNRQNREYIRSISDLLSSVNFVSSRYEQEQFFSSAKLKFDRAPMYDLS